MDNLASLSFTSSSSSSSSSNSKPPTAPTYNIPNFSVSRPTPPRSTGTPQPRGPSPANGTTKPANPDSFANLLNFGRNSNAANNTASLSLQEQQKRLQEARMKAEEEKRRQMDEQFGDGNFWDTLGGSSGRMGGNGSGSDGGVLASLGFNVPKPQVVVVNNKQEADDDEDLFAAFKAEAPVDKTSHFPPPASGATSAVVTPRFGTPNPPPALQKTAIPVDLEDPFDLMNIPSGGTISALPLQLTTTNDDDDFLGLLGKPVSELSPKPPVEQPKLVSTVQEQSPPVGGDLRDAAIAELMDMGFSLTQSKKALVETDTGLDVQQAVGWLLNEAHRQSRAVSSSSTETPVGQRDGSRSAHQEQYNRRQGSREDERRGASTSRRRDGSQPQPAWAREGGGSAFGGEKDIAAIASEVGSNLFKSANSLWSVGKKRMEKAMKELQQTQVGDGAGGGDLPKWMRDAQIYQSEEETGWRREVGDHGGNRKRAPQQPQPELLTDEALMLETNSAPPSRKSAAGRSADHTYPQQHQQTPSRGQSVSPIPSRQSPVDLQKQRQVDFAEQIRKKEVELREREARIAMERKAKLGRGGLGGGEEEIEAYVSPARRRGKASASLAPVSVVQEGNLLGGGGGGGGAGARAQEGNMFQHYQQMRSSPSSAPSKPSSTTASLPIRKAVPKRAPVPISPSDLSRSNKSRQKGTEAFKLGDYALALTHYTSALTPLPDNHTLRIVVLCNRALCNLKVGDAKACLIDCEEALTIIGEARGEGEVLEIDAGDQKEIVGFWEKAVARKAEGFEALEKWSEAGRAWGSLVEAGKGGSNALKGRSRCENAVRPETAPPPPPLKQAAPAAKRPPPPPPPKPTATTQQSQSQAAVQNLRKANATAEAIEAEKLSLYDSVTERINAWKKGKEGNLRALLTSLDQILWEGSGWAKVTMGQLVIPGKVKVVYMKGIAKVHPDKIPKEATTEQRMLCGTVFSLLNEAWDKFKVENNL
ncbi:UBA/TS-N domain-containing protein [Tirmania nivea]|nr:UBA/TS-N domain-containing protein [Tirmania nivea]